MFRKKIVPQTEQKESVFIDLASIASADETSKRRMRVAKVSGKKDLSLVINSLRQGYPIIINATEYTSENENIHQELKNIASGYGALVYEAAPSVWLVSPSTIRVEKVKSKG